MACRIYIIIPAHAQKSIIILILHLSVSDVSDVRSREGHLTRAKKFSFSSSLDLDVTCSNSLTQLAMAL